MGIVVDLIKLGFVLAVLVAIASQGSLEKMYWDIQKENQKKFTDSFFELRGFYHFADETVSFRKNEKSTIFYTS